MMEIHSDIIVNLTGMPPVPAILSFDPDRAGKTDVVPLADMLDLLDHSEKLPGYEAPPPPRRPQPILQYLEIGPAGIPIATREHPFGRLPWQNIDREDDPTLSVPDAAGHGTRTFIFPGLSMESPHVAQSGREKQIAGDFKRMLKTAHTSGWPVYLFFGRSMGLNIFNAAVTDALSVREPDGTLHWAVGVFVDESRIDNQFKGAYRRDEIDTILDHEKGHIPQVWDQAEKIIVKANDIEARLEAEGRPLPGRQLLEKALDYTLTGLDEVQAIDQQDPALLRRSTENIRKSHRQYRIEQDARFRQGVAGIVDGWFLTPDNESRRLEYLNWLADLLKSPLPSMTPPADEAPRPARRGNRWRRVFGLEILGLYRLFSALSVMGAAAVSMDFRQRLFDHHGKAAAAFRKLEGKDREVALFIAEGMSHSEVADNSGLTLAKVESILSYRIVPRLELTGFRDTQLAAIVHSLRVLEPTAGLGITPESWPGPAFSPDVKSRWLELPERHRDYGRFVALGFSNNDVADATMVSPQTVKNALSSKIFPKFGLSDSDAARTRLANIIYGVDTFMGMTPPPIHYPGTVFILSGPTGAGKSSLARAVIAKMPDLTRPALVTTRPKKDQEFDGDDYFFISPDQFRGRHHSGQLLETRLFGDHLYGTPVRPVLERLRVGRDVLLAGVPWMGIEQILKRVAVVVTIHIHVPRILIENRIRDRGREKGEELAQRLRMAAEHPDEKHLFTHLVTNITFDKALSEILAHIEAHRQQAVSLSLTEAA